MRPRRHAIPTALLGAALLSGCGQGGAGPTAPSAEPTAIAAADPTTDTVSPSAPAPPTDDDTASRGPSATPSTETATATTTATGCDPAASELADEVPNGAERVREVIGDLDGDDTPDRLVTWALTIDADETVFHLRVTTGSGFVAERELTEASAMADVRPLGTVPIGDGHRAALVVEDVGASAELVSVWGLHDWEDAPCSLGRLTVADDAASPVFPVGATAGATSALACAEVEGVPTLAVRTATASQDGESHDWEETHLYWEGAGALRIVSRDEGTFGAGDDRRADFASLHCAGVDL